MAETGRLSRAREPLPVREPGHGAAHRHHRHDPGRLGGARGVRLLYRDVVPSLVRDRRRADRAAVRSDLLLPSRRRRSTRSASRMVIGGVSGLAVGIAARRPIAAQRAYEAYLYYLGPTPKIIFFPIMIMWFGVGPGLQGRDGRDLLLLPGGAQRRRRHARDRQGADPRRQELPRQHLADGDQDLPAGDAASRSSTACGWASASR